MANAKFQKRMLAITETSGVKVILSDEVDRSFFKDEEWVVDGPVTVTTKKGVVLAGTDIVYKAVGIGIPKGKILSSPCFEKGTQLDASGFVIVDENFQVKGRPGLFALGDCVSYPNEAKSIMGIMGRLPVVTGNIQSFLKGSVKLPKIAKVSTSAAMIVPFGPKVGAGYMGSMNFPQFLVVAIKSKNLFTPENWKEVAKSKPPIKA